MAKKEKTKKSGKWLLWTGLAVLAAGVLSFVGFLSFGLITLARDLLFTAVFADVGLSGFALGRKAVDLIANRISSKKAEKDLKKTRSKQQEREEVEVIESIPENDQELSVSKEVSNIDKQATLNQEKSMGRKQ